DQLDGADQSYTTHGTVLHDWDTGPFSPAAAHSESATNPPVEISQRTRRVCTPLPHSRLQLLQLLRFHAYDGHGCVAHASSSAGLSTGSEPSRSIHFSSPGRDPSDPVQTTDRVREPPPHSAEQLDQFPTTNSKVGQTCVLQG